MHSNVVVLITADTIGKGDEELARILMRSFLKCLKEASPLPSAIHFLNRGVFLTTEGSDLLDDLRELAGQGVALYSCGTCLDYYKLRDKLVAGEVGNMAATVQALLSASHVVAP